MKQFLYAIHQHSEKRINIHCKVTSGFKYISKQYSIRYFCERKTFVIAKVVMNAYIALYYRPSELSLCPYYETIKALKSAENGGCHKIENAQFCFSSFIYILLKIWQGSPFFLSL